MQAPDPIAFTLFGIDIRWYGLLIGLAFMIGVLISYKRAPILGLNPDHVLDFCIFMIPASIIGARIYYIIFEWDMYAGNIRAMLDIRSGGLAIHGGLIFGIITAVLVCRYHKMNIWDLLDLIFPVVALGQAIGRWGNFFNSEAHGGPTDLPWAILVDGEYVHPTFLYESIWCLLLFYFLMYMTNHRSFSGQITLLYGLLYSLERFFVEGLRTDSLMIGQFRQAQVLSFCVFFFCLFGLLFMRKRKAKAALAEADAAASEGDAAVSETDASVTEGDAATGTDAIETTAAAPEKAAEVTETEAAEVVAAETEEAKETVETEATEVAETEAEETAPTTQTEA